MSSKPYFDKVAPQWDKMRSSFFPASIIDSMKEEMDIQPSMEILDLGAGSGFLTEGFVNYDVKITAMDQSQNMLDIMAKRLSEYSNVEYVVGDAENIEATEKRYDYILANMVLHHLEQPAQFIHSISRHLKPGGKLIITDLDVHNHVFLAKEQNDRWLGFLRSDIYQWYKDAGFIEVKVDCTEANCKSSSQYCDDYADITIFKAVGVA